MSRQKTAWDCGYSNLAALLRTLEKHGVLPSVLATQGIPTEITDLQLTIEAAWRAGFDQGSAGQFRNRLTGQKGKSGEIGAPEVLAALWHLQIDAFIVEIVQQAGAGRAVFHVAAAYFQSSHSELRTSGHLNVHCSSRPPLFLQRDGHSTSVLGVLSSPPRLIIRDPGDANAHMLRCMHPSELEGQQYQLVGVTGKRVCAEDFLSRRGEDPEPAAVWDQGCWTYSRWFKMRF